MEMTRKCNVNIKRTVENSVGKRSDFHFHVDELTASNYMPTYAGLADEKYAFDEMDDEFFKFLNEKAQKDGIYIRLVFASFENSKNGEAVFAIEYGDESETFATKELEKILEFEFADFGIKVQGSEITFGTTVEGGCGHTPYFAEFGSTRGNEEFLSLENPLNRHVISLMERMIVLD